MSLILENYVEDWRTAYNQIEYVLKETNPVIVAKPRFKYLFKIQVGATVLAILKVPPRDVTNLGRCDVQRIIETYLTKNLGDIDITATGESFTSCPNSIEFFDIYFGYEYLSGTSVVQFFVNYQRWDDLGVEKVNEQILVYNGSLPNERGNYLNFFDYQVSGYATSTFVNNGLTRKFLTNTPNVTSLVKDKDNLDFELTDNGFMYILNNTSETITSFKVDTFDATGTPNGFYEFTKGTVSADGIEMQYIPIAPNSINNIDPSLLVAGTQPVIDSTTSSYRVHLNDGVSRVSENRFFNVVETDCRFEKVRLEFMNVFGGFDSFNFTKANRRFETIERKMMKQNADDMSSLGRISYSQANLEKVQYHTKSMPKMKLVSDWISEQKFNWLIELMSSPEIYLHRDNKRIAVAKVSGNWEQKLNSANRLFNMEIEIEFSLDNYRQRS